MFFPNSGRWTNENSSLYEGELGTLTKLKLKILTIVSGKIPYPTPDSVSLPMSSKLDDGSNFWGQFFHF